MIPGKRKQRKCPGPCQSHKYSVRKTPGFSPSHSCSVGKRLDPIESRQAGKRTTSGQECLRTTTGTHESYLIKMQLFFFSFGNKWILLDPSTVHDLHTQMGMYWVQIRSVRNAFNTQTFGKKTSATDSWLCPYHSCFSHGTHMDKGRLLLD